jgi:hypothetical protein
MSREEMEQSTRTTTQTSTASEALAVHLQQLADARHDAITLEQEWREQVSSEHGVMAFDDEFNRLRIIASWLHSPPQCSMRMKKLINLLILFPSSVCKDLYPDIMAIYRQQTRVHPIITGFNSIRAQVMATMINSLSGDDWI